MHSKGFVKNNTYKIYERGKNNEEKTTEYYFPRNRRRIKNDKGQSDAFKSYRDGFYSQVLP